MEVRHDFAAGEEAMVALGRRLGEAAAGGTVIFLEGELGAGKTTLARGFVRSFGHRGAVKSPTYTLVEPYEFDEIAVYHLDLYRLENPAELEYIGIGDYFSERSLALVEWPERGAGLLPAPDLRIRIERAGKGRELRFEAHSPPGVEYLGLLPERPRDIHTITGESGVT